ncbi:MAG: hypothetical protein ACPGUY_09615, partial [Akkermansiaceae bacterium]
MKKSLFLSLSISAIAFSSTTSNARSVVDPEVVRDALTSKQLDSYQEEGRWLGPGWWGNRLQDWSLSKNKIVCAPNRPFLAWRVAHDTTRNLDATQGKLTLSVDLHMNARGGSNNKLADDAFSGILLGSGHTIADPMARLLMFDYGVKKGKSIPAVPGSGYVIGFSGKGELHITDLDAGKVLATAKTDKFSRNTKLTVHAEKSGNQVKLSASSAGQSVAATIPAARYRGGLGLVSHSGTRAKGSYTLDTHFSNYSVKGGHQRVSSQSVGPIVCAQYTVDRGVLKLSAQCMPLPDGTEIELNYRPEGKLWQVAGKKTIHKIDRNAVFRIEKWDATKAVPYRVLVRLPGIGASTYTGTIAAEPKKDTLRLAALGCVIHRPWGKARDWNDVLY